jgi:tRNA modification GTPase
MSTIFALATARGKSGVAVIRVSGPASFELGKQLAADVPSAGRFGLRRIRSADGSVLDEALVLAFKAPRSFTGEDVVELQLHGSRAVIQSVESAILETGLARPAEAGEFSRRALMNDTLDLAQVEGLSELIEAETEAQRKQAMRLYEGGLRELSEAWRADLLRAAALIEATIDFADEEVPIDVSPEVSALITRTSDSLAEEIAGSEVAERVRDGFEVAILGAPNAGKSTLLNRIAGREVAITSEIAGTTRDVIEVMVDLHGLPITFLDTAGLRDTEDTIERIGVARARERAERADLRVLLVSGDTSEEGADLLRDGDIRVSSKADLHGGQGISAVSGVGIDAFLEQVADILGERAETVGIATTARHRHALQRAGAELDLAAGVLAQPDALAEIAAEHLRAAVTALDSLIGRVDVEAILGEIFSRFCIGK